MSKHTPLPWSHGNYEFEDWGVIRGPDHMPVASTAMSARYDQSDLGHPKTKSGEVEANAELIVRAVIYWPPATRCWPTSRNG